LTDTQYEDELALEELLGVRRLILPRRSLLSLLTSTLQAGPQHGRALLASWAEVLSKCEQIVEYERVTRAEQDHAQLMLLVLLCFDEVSRAILLPEDLDLMRGAAAVLRGADRERAKVLGEFLKKERPVMVVTEALLAALPLLSEDDLYLAWLQRRLDGPTLKVCQQASQAEPFKALRDQRNRLAHPPARVTHADYQQAMQGAFGTQSMASWLSNGALDPRAGLLDVLLRGLV
jgi:hypothetical protein